MMKASVLLKAISKSLACLILLLALAFSGKSQLVQTSNELVFENSVLYSGQDGKDGAVYRFPLVNNDLDALVKITGRSSSLVSLSNIDLGNTGFKKAFQPQIKYSDGSISGAASWWMEFEIQFVNKNTTTLASITNFNLTGLDIDGDDDKLKEWHAYYAATSYTLEAGTQLSVSDMTGTIAQPTLTGKKFTGATTGYSGIDTTATDVMTTLNYQNINTFVVRFGGSTSGSASSANRMYSVWFKSFNFNSPNQVTLPVILKYFTASLKDENVSLKWEASLEENFSHYILQRSYNGSDYNDIATVFGNGQAGFMKYAYTDASVLASKGVAYYRLLMVDKDGEAKYSEVKLIRFGKQKESMNILTYPNPVSSELRITIPGSWQGRQVKFDILNSNGQLVKSIQNNQASQTETITVNNLAKGFYIVKASMGTETAQQPIIKN